MKLFARLAITAVLVLAAGCGTNGKDKDKNEAPVQTPPAETKMTETSQALSAERKPAETPEAAAGEKKPAEAAPEAETPAVEAEKKEDTEKMAKISYAIGYFNGASFKQQSIDVTTDDFVRGMKDGLSGATPASSEDEMRALLQSFGQEMRTKMMEKMRVQGEENKKKGEEFLKANAAKEGVKTTASGLQYKVITEGTGLMPTANDIVKVHYKGMLIDGKEFDSSYTTGEPVEFPVGGVIPGWTEALQLMKVGSKYELFIPADLAYGLSGRMPVIGPNEALIFEVELLDIVKPEAPGEPEVKVAPVEAPAAIPAGTTE